MVKNDEMEDGFPFYNKLFHILYFISIGLVIILLVVDPSIEAFEYLVATSGVYLIVRLLCTNFFYDKIADPILHPVKS
jgi:hypothetical protein